MTPDQDSREDIKLDLASEALGRGGEVRIRAQGTSMLPAVWPGDLLTIEGAPYEQIAPGDIVLARRDNRFFIHRLIERRQDRGGVLWITRGDAVPQNDPPALASQLLGRVTGIRRAQRDFVPSRRVSRMNSAVAWMLCHWDRFRSICLRMHSLRQSFGEQA
jgi:signal peptidase